MQIDLETDASALLDLIETSLDNLKTPAFITAPNVDAPLITFVNKALSKILGFGQQELVGHTPGIFSGFSPKDLDQDIRRELSKGKPVTATFDHVSNVGDRLTQTMLISPLVIKGSPLAFMAIAYPNDRINALQLLSREISKGVMLFSGEKILYLKPKMPRRKSVYARVPTYNGLPCIRAADFAGSSVERDLALAKIRWALVQEYPHWLVDAPGSLLDNNYFPRCVTRFERLRQQVNKPPETVCLVVHPRRITASLRDNIQTLKNIGWSIGVSSYMDDAPLSFVPEIKSKWSVISWKALPKRSEIESLDYFCNLVKASGGKVLLDDLDHDCSLVPAIKKAGVSAIRGSVVDQGPNKKLPTMTNVDLEQALRLAQETIDPI